ncbi:2-hydroxyacid dehydrogenase [Vulcanimicrobium alpinum]|uniref:2-hydroxyacid dehydrogenase n=1 Tax=Vulcanimicrobium alpinum TaxID=3016050 RepID=A0AAN2CBH8_UNVUL|nr:D-2-hydroxyacid dehydrogenase [Vulcanimicrobium alpinum]BDE08038.1 2-hydroxyacid dehydrogenase [Vulcanimicrobium alpinum]
MIVMVASPLEAALVERIRACDAVSEVLYDPALLPPPRYPCDHGGDPSFARDAAGEARWQAMLARADAILGYPNESPDGLRASLAAGPRIRWVQGTSAGMGAHIRRAQLNAATLERVTFTSAAGVHAGMLAEFAFYGLLALRKDAARLAAIRAERAWQHYPMGELDGSTIAIVGMGQIGRAIAQRARAFGMRVTAVNRSGEPDPLAERTFPTAQVREALAGADAVVVTLPITERTHHLVDAAALAALAPAAIVVNVGRGAVIDQAALIDALQRGTLAGAVLDVFDPEPLPPDNPLWTMPNVIFSPHTAALSLHENARIADLLCENARRVARGDRPRNLVNLREFY